MAEPKREHVTSTDANRDPITGEPGAHPVGTGVGTAAGGAAAGAAGGAAAGPTTRVWCGLPQTSRPSTETGSILVRDRGAIVVHPRLSSGFASLRPSSLPPGLTFAVDDPSLAQVIGRDLDLDAVPGHDPDE